MALVYWYVLFNVLAFVIYGLDKSFARKDKRRVSERTLILVAVVGGAIGALAAMLIFHHKTRKPKFKLVPVFFVINVALILCFLWNNYHLTVSEQNISLGIPEEVTIVQVSDLHNQFFGINQSILLKRIEEQSPDIICVTGDIVDMNHTNYEIALDFVRGAVKIAPVYYITGNHEVFLEGEKLDSFFDSMKDLGVIFLDDTYVDMGDYILAGVAERSLVTFGAYEPFDDTKPVILLGHEPRYTDLYRYLGADLVLSGHNHGGQVIIPGKGGMVSPEFEFFPEFYGGLYDIDGMKLVLSRGLGNSVLPVRINNYPEIVTIHVN
ncbi:MAG: DUF1294 domain-containing protein [Saccharofermentans sp.]|nr:DUF1294 domain-containing protein [Saccharofermentans sp.]